MSNYSEGDYPSNVECMTDEYSFSFSTSYWYGEAEWYFPTWFVVWVHLVMCFFTVFGNLLVILAYIRDDRIRNTPAYTIILNLALADFMIGALILPPTTLWWVFDKWVFGRALCKLYLVLDYTLFSMSTFTVVYISLDRYWLVTKALDYRTFQTRRRVVSVLSMAWAVAVLFYNFIAHIAPLISTNESEFHPRACELEVVQMPWYNIFGIVIQFLVPFMALVVLNYSVYSNIRARSIGLVTTKHRLFRDDPACQTRNAAGTTAMPGTKMNVDGNHGNPGRNAVTNDHGTDLARYRHMEASGSARAFHIAQGMTQDAMPVTCAIVGRKGESVKMTPLTIGDDGEIRTATEAATRNGPGIDTESANADRGVTEVQTRASGIQGVNRALKVPCSLPVPGTWSHSETTKATNERREQIAYQREKSEFKRHRKAAITLAAIVIVYSVFCFPYFIYSIIVSFCKACVSYTAWEVVSYLLWTRAAINPFIYGFTNLLLRRNFAKIMYIDKCLKGGRVSPVM